MKNDSHYYDLSVKVKLQDSGSLQALASVTIDNAIEIHGWKVMNSNRTHQRFQEMIWIQPPSILVNGKNRNAVFITNEGVFQQFEDAIYDAYHLKKTQNKDNNKGYSVDDIADDIPF